MATWKLVPDTGQTSGTNSNMPLVIIPSVLEMGSLTLAEAQSVRIYSDASLTTELAREVVSADEIHVKASSVSSSTELYVDFDGVRSDYAVTATYGRNAVWSDYLGVWHLDSTTDSTGNGFTLTEVGGITVGGATGRFGDATNFDGIDDLLKTATSPWNGVGDFTASVWEKSSSANNNMNFIGIRENTSGSQNNGLFSSRDSGSDTAQALFRDTANSYTKVATISNDIIDGNWHYIVARRSGTTGFIWADAGGSGNIASVTGVSGDLANSNNVLTFNSSVDNDFAGDMEEGRIADIHFSDDWLTTEYNNQNDNAAFWVATDVGGSPTPTVYNALAMCNF